MLKPAGTGMLVKGVGPAAFRRLCVETARNTRNRVFHLPAAFRRLCVETATSLSPILIFLSSRLQAAVC